MEIAANYSGQNILNSLFMDPASSHLWLSVNAHLRPRSGFSGAMGPLGFGGCGHGSMMALGIGTDLGQWGQLRCTGCCMAEA